MKIHKHIKHKLNYRIKPYTYLRYANSTWTPTSIHSINPPIFPMILLSLRPCLLSLTLLGLEDMAMWSLTLGRSPPTWRACVLDENDNGILFFFHEWLKHHHFFEGHVFHVNFMILYVYMYLYIYTYTCVSIGMFDILLIYVYNYFHRTYIYTVYVWYIHFTSASLLTLAVNHRWGSSPSFKWWFGLDANLAGDFLEQNTVHCLRSLAWAHGACSIVTE